jgi:hypothetical protein
MRWFLGWLAGVVAVEFFGTLPLRGIGLTFQLQLPNSYPCIRIHRPERQFDLFVGVKGNVDAVQSRAASAWGGLTLANEHAPCSKGWSCKFL